MDNEERDPCGETSSEKRKNERHLTDIGKAKYDRSEMSSVEKHKYDHKNMSSIEKWKYERRLM